MDPVAAATISGIVCSGITALGAVGVKLYAARGTNAKEAAAQLAAERAQSDAVAINVYGKLVEALSLQVAELQKEVRVVSAAEADCRKATGEMAVEIRWLQDSVRMLQEGTFPKRLQPDNEGAKPVT